MEPSPFLGLAGNKFPKVCFPASFRDDIAAATVASVSRPMWCSSKSHDGQVDPHAMISDASDKTTTMGRSKVFRPRPVACSLAGRQGTFRTTAVLRVCHVGDSLVNNSTTKHTTLPRTHGLWVSRGYGNPACVLNRVKEHLTTCTRGGVWKRPCRSNALHLIQ